MHFYRKRNICVWRFITIYRKILIWANLSKLTVHTVLKKADERKDELLDYANINRGLAIISILNTAFLKPEFLIWINDMSKSLLQGRDN